MENEGKLKICFAASSGGHLEEIMNLKQLEDEWETVLLTEKTKYPVRMWMDKIYYVPQVNRKEVSCVIKMIKNLFISMYLLHKEKPNVVISIGALATVPVCMLAKFKGIRLIYIESFARIDCPSKTGKLLYKIADVCIVQWKEMLEYFPRAIYGGPIY